jgi:dephospho-CoA kinase
LPDMPEVIIKGLTNIRIIGLTGGIACGKSSVSKLLAQNGIKVINADELAHRAIEPDGPAYSAVVKEFGCGIVKEDGRIDRRKLGEIVFKDRDARKRLESFVHPVVMTEIKQAIQQAKEAGSGILVVEIQLLFEVGWEDLFDQIWVVSASIEEQLKRLQERDQLTKQKAMMRIAAQLPLSRKVDKADVVIDNSKGFSDLEAQVLHLIKTVE